MIHPDTWALDKAAVAWMFNEFSEQPSTKNTLVHSISLTQVNIDQKLLNRVTYSTAADFVIDCVHCYSSSAEVTVAQIEAFASEACHNLLTQSDLKEGRHTLKVFHTSYALSAKGKPSYIQFSTQWLYDEEGIQYFDTEVICLTVLNKFNTLCQSDPDVMWGRELWINKRLKFNADFTDLDSNR